MLHRVRRFGRMVIAVTALFAVPITAVVAVVPPPTVSAAGNEIIAQRGDRSPKVVQLQQLLQAAGITVKGGADGIFGPGTETAVRTYQQRKGLTVNGKADTPTATALGMVPATPLMAKGANGQAVVAMQQQLIAVGINVKGGADGWYGSGTTAAVSAFQTSRGLPATGALDAATAAILANAAAGAKPAAASPPPAPAPAPAPSPVAPPPAGSILFPMPKTCAFANTWGAPRSGGRKHQGVDIIAKSGTPLYAVQTGTITKRQTDYRGSLAGNALWLTLPDGTYYFYAHLSSFADGIGVGTKVTAGTVIGYVGKTGNASVPHLHFEVHPNGGAAVNPYPIVKAVSGC